MSYSVNNEQQLNQALATIDAITTPGTYTITFTGNITEGTDTGQSISYNGGSLSAPADLYAINLHTGVDLVINGGNYALDGANTYRGLFAYAGTVDVQNLTIQNAVAQGGAGAVDGGGGGGGAGLGGGLFVAGPTQGAGGANVTIDNVKFSNDSAIGGDGGSGFYNDLTNRELPYDYGAGGGMGGAGGGHDYFDGGGGVGIGATGFGQAATSSGYKDGGGILLGAASGGGTSLTAGGPNGGGGGPESGGGAGGKLPNEHGGGGTGGFGGGGGDGYKGGFGGGGGDNGEGGFGGGGGGGGDGYAGGFGAGQGGKQQFAGPATTAYNRSTTGGGGGGGLGAGGDVFVMSGGSLTVEGGNLGSGNVRGGTGGLYATGGEGLGTGVFLESGETLAITAGPGQTFLLGGGIAGESGAGTYDFSGGGTLELTSGGEATADTVHLSGSDEVRFDGSAKVAAITNFIGEGETQDSLFFANYPTGVTFSENGPDSATVDGVAITGTFTSLYEVAYDGGTLVRAGSVEPVISGTGATTTLPNQAVSPFANVTLTDDNLRAQDYLLIAMSGAAGTLSGVQTTGNGGYLLQGTAGAVTSELRAVTFTPGAAQPGGSVTSTFTLTDMNNVWDDTQITDSNTTVSVTEAAQAPTITGSVAEQADPNSQPIDPFANVTIFDPNGAQDILSISVTGGDGGTLTIGVPYSTVDNTYQISGTAGALTADLRNDVFFTPNAPPDGLTSTVTLTLTDQSTAYEGPPAMDDNTSVIAGTTTASTGPSISGTQANQINFNEAPIDPFSGVTISDQPTAQDVLIITLSGEGGTLTGATPSGPAEYFLQGTAQEITQALDLVSFTPNAGPVDQATPTFFTLQDTSDDPVTMVTDSTTSVIDINTGLCFLRGTQILCPAGQVPVQDLAIGDLVQTLSGKARAIAWIGKGRVLATRGRRNAATPVIVGKSAFADNIPNHDLRVTRGHAFAFDGVLIPIEFLVNHRSILWDDRAQEVELYHVELETHDILIANGAAAESYRDDGNRWLFQNANSGWNMPPKLPCAPVLTGGPVVDAVWRRLLDRAGPRPGVPLTEDPDLHLMIDGQRVDATARHGTAHIFAVPNERASVSIVSLGAAPAELGTARDPRVLGIAVRWIAVRDGTRFRVMEAGDALLADGFHAFEPSNGLRWTDGNAALPQALFDGFDGPTELVLHLGGTTQYPLFGEVARTAA
ncbi:Hint domain-containing protein [Acidisphaera sp. S103]|uniref:Hint domain-containing protein n=1 Tax=Acidisphaera sp. S103 TaxID=1747223 RepID=UPI00273A51AD|nr:Hint domain-containing protein [Acidisphaera sp. S103]